MSPAQQQSTDILRTVAKRLRYELETNDTEPGLRQGVYDVLREVERRVEQDERLAEELARSLTHEGTA